MEANNQINLIQQANAQLAKLETELELTDIGCAELIAHSDKIKFCGNEDAYMWDASTSLWKHLDAQRQVISHTHKILQPIVEDKFKRYQSCVDKSMKDVLKKLQGMKKNMVKLSSAVKLKNVISACGDCTVDPLLFNSKLKEGLYPIKSGVLDVKTMKTRPRARDDYFTFQLDVDLSSTTVHAEEFLRSFCPKNDDETYNYFLDILSYSCTAFNWLKKFFIFHGGGDNGKSLVLKVLENMLGPLYTSIGENVFKECKVKASTTPELHQCVGKFIGAYSETTTDMLNETVIKQITGDDTITINPKYRDAYKVKLFMKLILSGNDKPNWRNEPAMFKRVEFFPFKFKFVKNPVKPNERLIQPELEDLFLNTSYKDELFTLLMNQAHDLNKRRKLTPSKFIETEKKKYVAEIDTTDEFLNLWRPKKNPMPSKGLIGKQVFKEYCQWCDNNNKRAISKGDFLKKLKKVHKPRDKPYRNNTVYDIEMKCQDEFELEESPTELDNDDMNELIELRKVVAQQRKEIETLKKQLNEKVYDKTVKDLMYKKFHKKFASVE